MPAGSTPVVQALAFLVGCAVIQALGRYADLVHEVLVAMLVSMLIALTVVAVSAEESWAFPEIVWDGAMD